MPSMWMLVSCITSNLSDRFTNPSQEKAQARNPLEVPGLMCRLVATNVFGPQPLDVQPVFVNTTAFEPPKSPGPFNPQREVVRLISAKPSFLRNAVLQAPA